MKSIASKAFGTLLVPLVIAFGTEYFLGIIRPTAEGGLNYVGDVIKDCLSEDVLKASRITCSRFLQGYLIALFIAYPLGLAIGRIKTLHNIFMPTISVLRCIPSAVVIPLALLLSKSVGDEVRIFVVVYGALWPLLLQVAHHSASVPKTYLQLAHSLGRSKVQSFFEIVVPCSFPGVVAGSRIGIAIGLLLTVTSEMLVVSDSSGLGYMILDSERSFEHNRMFAAIVMVGFIGVIFDAILFRLEREVKGKYTRHGNG